MVLRLIVGFSEKQDVVLCQRLQHAFLLFPASGNDPGTDRHANAGLSCTGTKSFDWACQRQGRRHQDQAYLRARFF
jgi:hypothetical protein